MPTYNYQCSAAPLLLWSLAEPATAERAPRETESDRGPPKAYNDFLDLFSQMTEEVISVRMAHSHDLLRPRIEGRAENGCPHIGGLCITAVVCKRAVPDVGPSEVLRALSDSATQGLFRFV